MCCLGTSAWFIFDFVSLGFSEDCWEFGGLLVDKAEMLLGAVCLLGLIILFNTIGNKFSEQVK